MSPRRLSASPSPPALAELRRLSVLLGTQVRDARRARKWSVAELARRAELSTDMVYRVEAGSGGSVQTCARLAVALGRHVELSLIDPRRREVSQPSLSADVVHSAMGELEAAHLRRLGYRVGIDEPYQHYQFAGRADLVAWDPDSRALLHIENRTRFPDLQEAAGSFNAKRAYLGAALAVRLGIGRWASETHVIAGLWSAEMLHVVRLRTATLRAICPDPATAFEAWWSGDPAPRGTTSTLILLDPAASGRQRAFIDLGDALTARPRHRGYAEAASILSGP